MEKNAKIYVAGHTGLLGSALMRLLEREGYTHLIHRTKEQLDLRDQHAVNCFFAIERPEYVFLAAALVGGIGANIQSPAEFIYDNLMIQTNVIHAAYRYGVHKLLFVGSSCIYPVGADQPMQENALLTGPLEATNESYAVAKIAGIKLCQAYNKQYGTTFITCMVTNMYGPHDLFDVERSHVVPALIKKIHHAHHAGDRIVEVWGSGNPLREFIYVDDSAQALLFLMHNYQESDIINVGTGCAISIADLVSIIACEIGYTGDIRFNSAKPDGVLRKVLDVQRINRLGWFARVSLQEGIQKTVVWYRQCHADRSNEMYQKGTVYDV